MDIKPCREGTAAGDDSVGGVSVRKCSSVSEDVAGGSEDVAGVSEDVAGGSVGVAGIDEDKTHTADGHPFVSDKDKFKIIAQSGISYLEHILVCGQVKIYRKDIWTLIPPH